MAQRLVSVDDNFDLPAPVMQRLDRQYLTPAEADAKYESGSLAPLYGYFGKLGLARIQRCEVLMMGDSIMEGFGAKSLDTRWLAQAQTVLRERFTKGTQGWGYLPARIASPPGAGGTFDGWAYSGTRGLSDRGIGAKSYVLSHSATTPGSATVRRTFTSVKLFFDRQAADQVIITIEGQAPVTFTMNTNVIQQVWTSPVLPSASRSITVTQTGGSNSAPILIGGYFYNGDETAGLALWDGSFSGSRMQTWDVDTPAWMNWLTIPNFSLVVLGCATNDSRVSSSGYSAAKYKTHIDSIITKIRAKLPNVPVLLMPPNQPVTTGSNMVEPWENYMAVLRQVAGETPYVAFYDMSSRIPYINPDVYGFFTDGVHPTDLGHAALANLAVSALSPK